jgi:hypothetical protein
MDRRSPYHPNARYPRPHGEPENLPGTPLIFLPSPEYLMSEPTLGPNEPPESDLESPVPAPPPESDLDALHAETHERDTREHIAHVRHALTVVQGNLAHRAWFHDASKLVEPERSGYMALVARLQDIEYGSPAYKAALAEAREVVQHHYAHNSHHPQHYKEGMLGMSLLDLIEMFCDWYAAGKRTKDGSLAKSIFINFSRPESDPTLAKIFHNTRLELGWD